MSDWWPQQRAGTLLLTQGNILQAGSVSLGWGPQGRGSPCGYSQYERWILRASTSGGAGGSCVVGRLLWAGLRVRGYPSTLLRQGRQWQSLTLFQGLGIVINSCFFSFFLGGHLEACGVPVPWPGMELVAPASAGGSLTTGPWGHP